MIAIDADEIVYESIDSSDTAKYEYEHGTGIFAVRKEDIDAMPTIQPEQHWIPCSERLPETGSFLVTFKEEFDEAVDIDFYDAENEMWYDHDSDLVIAWMPLPEPFKG